LKFGMMQKEKSDIQKKDFGQKKELI